MCPGVSADALVLATADTEPFASEDADGLYDLIVAEAATRLGLALDIVRLPSDRSLLEAARGRVDGEYARIAGLEATHPTLRRVAEPLGEFDFVVYATEPGPKIRDWSDLAELHIAYISGWRFLDEHVTTYRSLTLVPNEQALFDLLLAGRVDAILYNRQRGDRFIAANRIDGIAAGNPPLAVRPMYLYLHERNVDLVEPLEQVLAVMRADGTIRSIERRVSERSEQDVDRE